MSLVTGLLLMQITWTVTPVEFTVGDSVTLSASVRLDEAGGRVRVSNLPRSDDYYALLAPQVRYVSGEGRIQYVIAAFSTGHFDVALPPVDVMMDDGSVRSLESAPIQLAAVALLPDGAMGDSTVEPRWSQPPVARATRDYGPAILFGWLGFMMVAAWGFVRRRIAARPTWENSTLDPPAPVTSWVTAGEPRAVAALVMTRLRRELARRVEAAHERLSVDECMTVLERERPHWPLERIGDLMHTVNRASLAPAVPSDVLVTVDEVKELIASFDGLDAPEETSDVLEPVEAS